MALNLEKKLIAAVPAPFNREGRILGPAQDRYVEHMKGMDLDGVAVWAHTGRGLMLSPEQRGMILQSWREGLGPDGIVIAAAGASPGSETWDQCLTSARRMADQAAEGGADALMVHPPTFARSLPDVGDRVEAFHAAVAGAGLPLVLFYLYEKAGGISYEPALLDRLLSRPEVVGIKMATLDSVMTFQDIAALITERHPDKTLITGEDRFLGYSLMCGATAALIGMAAANTRIQTELLRSYWSGDFERFRALNPLVDCFARFTFTQPMEGYIKRMLWCLVIEGVIPIEAANDPWGPELANEEFQGLTRLLQQSREGRSS